MQPQGLNPVTILTLLWIVEAVDNQHLSKVSVAVSRYTARHPRPLFNKILLGKAMIRLQIEILSRCNWRVTLDERDLMPARIDLRACPKFLHICEFANHEAALTVYRRYLRPIIDRATASSTTSIDTSTNTFDEGSAEGERGSDVQCRVGDTDADTHTNSLSRRSYSDVVQHITHPYSPSKTSEESAFRQSSSYVGLCTRKRHRSPNNELQSEATEKKYKPWLGRLVSGIYSIFNRPRQNQEGLSSQLSRRSGVTL